MNTMTESNPFTAAPAQQHLAAERHLLELRGTENQRERYYAGLLPEDELLMVARELLFAPFGAMRRWAKIHADAVRHRKNCDGVHGLCVTFTTRTAPSVSADAWATFKTIRDIGNTCDATFRPAGVKVNVEIIEHVGECASCHATITGVTASVQIEWAGRPLSREYSLVAQ